MSKVSSRKLWSVSVVLLLTLAACQGGDGDEKKVTGDVKAGGTLRIGIDAIPYTGGFDPTAEYLGDMWGLYSQALLRGLVAYRHVSGDAGNVPVPDMAAAPEVSDDGLVYTFTLKKGVKWSPPLNRDVVAGDFVTAFERLATKGMAAYGNYFGTPPNPEVIKGLHAFYNEEADSIAGVEAVDDYTFRLTLTKPYDNLMYVLAMPAARALPKEITRCFTTNGSMGRHVVSSGPYMFEGTDQLKIEGVSCSDLKKNPISGFDPSAGFTLIRNPNYDKATDSTELRENFVDKVTVEIIKERTAIFDKIKKNEIDITWQTPPAQYIKEYTQDEALKSKLHSYDGDRTWFLSMNLTEPPFDDVNVRRAVNFVMDKAALVSKWGGATAGSVATHILPPLMLDNELGQDYDPYKSEGFKGDLEAAKAAMRQSKYDTNDDGICDAPHCKKVLFINRDTPPQADLTPVVEEGLAKIGITTVTRETPDHYTLVGDASTHFGISANAGWGKDYSDAVTYAILFDGRALTDTPENEAAVGNYSYVGLTEDLAQKIGINLPAGHPNVDADIDKCTALVGEERNTCWVNFDKKITEEVVPWVPYLWANNINIVSDAVTKYEYDQFSTDMSIVHIAVDPSKQK